MATFVSNRDSGGRTDEEGHYKFWNSTFVGNVLNGQEVVQNSPSTNMNVRVSEGILRIPYSDYAYQAWSEGYTLVSIGTSDPSNPRVDRIVAYIDRSMSFTTSDINNPGLLKYKSVPGTPNAVPSKASDAAVQSSVGALNPWCELSTVRVNAAATQILNSHITDTRSFVNLASNIAANHLSPVGSVQDFAGTTAPGGWLLCYGQAISRNTYSTLFSTIGTVYGVGDGTTTFNLPDCRGRVVAGKDNMGGTSADRLTNLTYGVDGDVIGSSGGEQAHVQSVLELASHSHSITPIFMPSGTGSLALNDRSADSILASDNAANGSNGEYWGGAKLVTNTGNGNAFNVVQPTIIFNKIIKY